MFVRENLYQLVKLSIPLCLSGLLNSAVFFFETLFLARLGPDILAASALVGWLAGTLIVIIFGLLSSVNISVAHLHGAGDKKGISLVARDGFWLALLFVIPIIALFWNIAPILLLLGQNEAVVALATTYLHAWSWGILPQLIMIALLEVIMGLGHMRIILLATVFEVTLSVLLSYLLIFGKLGLPALGISGAGWAISISYWITALCIIIFVATHKEYQLYFNQLFKFTKPFRLTELFRVGMPMGLMYCIEVGFFFVLTLLMGSFGTNVLAANQVVMQYNGLLISIIFAIAQAVTVRMGHLLGAKNTDAAKAVGYIGVGLSAAFMLLAAFCFWFFPSYIIASDFDISLSQNRELVQLATQFLFICAFFQIFEAMRIAFFGALRALRDTRFTLLISILSFWGVALPLGYCLAMYLNAGSTGLWWGMVISAVLSVILLAWRYQLKIRDYQV